MIKGTRVLLGAQAREYQSKIEEFRSSLHRRWL